MLFASDPACRVVYVTSEWTAFSGRPAAHLLGLKWLELIHPAERNAAYLATRQAGAEKLSIIAQCRIRRADEEYVWMRIDARPCFTPDNRAFVGHIGMFTAVEDQSSATASVSFQKATPAEFNLNLSPSRLAQQAIDHLTIAIGLLDGSRNAPALRAVELGLFLLNQDAGRLRQ